VPRRNVRNSGEFRAGIAARRIGSRGLIRGERIFSRRLVGARYSLGGTRCSMRVTALSICLSINCWLLIEPSTLSSAHPRQTSLPVRTSTKSIHSVPVSYT
jgi:hypothetical protein